MLQDLEKPRNRAMSSYPEAYLVHITPGRLRIRIPSRKRDLAYFSYLVEELSGFQGIERIEANPTTGGVLIIHTGEFKGLEECASAKQLFTIKESISGSGNPSQDENTEIKGQPSESKEKKTYTETLMQRMGDSFRDLDKRTSEFTNGELDLASTAFVGLLSLGIYQFFKGRFALPAWYTAFWYALNIYNIARPKRPIKAK